MGSINLESNTHIDLDLFAYIDGQQLDRSKNYSLLRLVTDHIFQFTSRLPPDLKREFVRTALELDSYLGKRYRENMSDLRNMPSEWDTLLSYLNLGDVHISEYDFLDFYADSLYVFTKKVHKVNYPYEFLKPNKPNSKLRRR